MISTVRVQEKGQVTIPRSIRQQLKVKKGDLVTFVSTEQGVVIKTLDQAANDLFATLEANLAKRGILLSDLLGRAQTTSAEILVSEYNLRAEERKIFFQALQLRALAAVEAIRSISDTNDEISDAAIEAEIQAARNQE